MKKLCFTFTLLFVGSVFAQTGSTYEKNSKAHEYYDSLRTMEYKGIFPLLGKGAYKKGFDIPYPVGIMANVMIVRQGLEFTDFKLGVKTDNQDIPTRAIDIVEFGETTTQGYSYTFRPDLWLLPFLNVYGILGFSQTETTVNLVSPINLTSVVEQNTSTLGFGIMGAGGIGPMFISVDANFTWNKPVLLEKPVQVNVLGLRTGHAFKFKQRPDRNIAVWVGGMRVSMNSGTVGTITLREALPEETWEKKDNIVADYYEWYNGLDPNNLADQVKIKAADEVFTPFVEELDAKNGDAIIRYEMNKAVEEKWNFILGGQFQINKHWQIRVEGGIIGNRKSFLSSVNYRFVL